MKFSVHCFRHPSTGLRAEFVRTADGHRSVNLYGALVPIQAFAKAFHPVVDGTLYAVPPRNNTTGVDSEPLYAAVEGPRNQTFGKFLIACAALGMEKR